MEILGRGMIVSFVLGVGGFIYFYIVCILYGGRLVVLCGKGLYVRMFLVFGWEVGFFKVLFWNGIEFYDNVFFVYVSVINDIFDIGVNWSEFKFVFIFVDLGFDRKGEL